MNELKRYVIVISVVEGLSGAKSWCGETHIQKAIYFLEKLFPEVIDYPFILYKHGPFSFELRDDIGIMVAGQFLKLVPMFPYGPRILTGELAGKTKELFPKTLKEHEKRINFIAEKLAPKDVGQLETLATALYITLESHPNAIIEKRARKLCEFKPHIPLESAKKGIEEVDQIIEEAQKY